MKLTPEDRLILENQFAIMEALAQIATEATTKYRIDTRPLRRQMTVTNAELRDRPRPPPGES